MYVSYIGTAQEKSVAYDLNRDKPNLFSLADAVLAASKTRRWSTWVVDARSAHFVSKFLYDVLAMNEWPDELPEVVAIANSRSVRDDPRHKQAVLKRLAKPRLGVSGNNVLIVSEYSQNRHGLAALTTPLRTLGASAVDAAVLCLDNPYYSAFTKLPSDGPDQIYKGTPNAYEPAMYSGILNAAIGQLCRPGTAEPLPRPNTDPSLHTYVTGEFEKLAIEYATLRS